MADFDDNNILNNNSHSIHWKEMQENTWACYLKMAPVVGFCVNSKQASSIILLLPGSIILLVGKQ